MEGTPKYVEMPMSTIPTYSPEEQASRAKHSCGASVEKRISVVHATLDARMLEAKCKMVELEEKSSETRGRDLEPPAGVHPDGNASGGRKGSVS
jgi:hypothetical protein